MNRINPSKKTAPPQRTISGTRAIQKTEIEAASKPNTVGLVAPKIEPRPNARARPPAPTTATTLSALRGVPASRRATPPPLPAQRPSSLHALPSLPAPSASDTVPTAELVATTVPLPEPPRPTSLPVVESTPQTSPRAASVPLLVPMPALPVAPLAEPELIRDLPAQAPTASQTDSELESELPVRKLPNPVELWNALRTSLNGLDRRRRFRAGAIGAALGVAALAGALWNARVHPVTADAATARGASTVPVAPVAKPASAAAAVGLAGARPVANDPRAPGGSFVDGSDSKAPTCEELLVNADSKRLFVDKELKAARRELVRGNLDAAQAASCKLARWATNNPGFMLDLAQLLLLRRDGKAASEWAVRALEIEPLNARGLGILADALARVGKTEEARKALFDAARRPETDGTLRALTQQNLLHAQAALANREYPLAERLFRRVLVFNPQHAAASAGIAKCLLNENQAAAARAWLERTEAGPPAGASPAQTH